MARNIDEAILQRDPGAKVFIYAGGMHGAKRPQWGGNVWMALRLWRRTGIEPFSVFQMSDAGDPAYDWPLYHLLVKSGGRRFPEAQAVRWPTGFSEEIPEALRQHPVYSHLIEHGVDAIVLHPPEPLETAAERPAWLQPEDAAEIVGTVLRDEAPCEGCLVQALVEAEGELSTPADQVLTDEQGRYQLRVRAGRYRLRVWAPAEGAGDEYVVATLPAITSSARQTVRRDVRLPQPD
jgi:hypothetical protein